MAMRDIFIVVTIVVFWFILTSFLFFLNSDPSLAELSNLEGIAGNISTQTGFNVTQLNSSTEQLQFVEGQVNLFSFITMFFRMFTFSLPLSIVPVWLNFIISFLNFLLLGVLGVTVYRLASPATG